MTEAPEPTEIKVARLVRESSRDVVLIELRANLLDYASDVFKEVGLALEVIGHIVGSDRSDRSSPFGHGSDEAVGVGLILRIGGGLAASSLLLFQHKELYGAAALLRQVAEVEYLAWAFEAKDREAQRWLRSDKSERLKFFTPKKLRDAAGDKFRSKDYGYHCELGGHPVPGARILLDDKGELTQLLIVDLLGHLGRTWDHLAGWANSGSHGKAIAERNAAMVDRFMAWKRADPVARLPAPP